METCWMVTAALVKSDNRFEKFKTKLKEHDCEIIAVDFDDPHWFRIDLQRADFLLFFPTFESSSNRPDSLSRVKHNLMFLHRVYPELAMFPDPNVIPFYNDKYAQYLFLSHHGFPIPRTLALDSAEALATISKEITYPCVLKNRYGAGGDFVFKVEDERELADIYEYSRLCFSSGRAKRLLWKNGFSRKFYRSFFDRRRAEYPFLSFPLLAQEFIDHSKDLKMVIGDYEPIEGHWRRQGDISSWKMNIDGGGVGEWSFIPEEIQALSVQLAQSLRAKWLNIDYMFRGDEVLISEFSPVWHHYAMHEKAGFVYKDDYNLRLSAERAADLEELIVSSYTAGLNSAA